MTALNVMMAGIVVCGLLAVLAGVAFVLIELERGK